MTRSSSRGRDTNLKTGFTSEHRPAGFDRCSVFKSHSSSSAVVPCVTLLHQGFCVVRAPVFSLIQNLCIIVIRNITPNVCTLLFLPQTFPRASFSQIIKKKSFLYTIKLKDKSDLQFMTDFHHIPWNKDIDPQKLIYVTFETKSWCQKWLQIVLVKSHDNKWNQFLGLIKVSL